jgi:hypothetical protein
MGRTSVDVGVINGTGETVADGGGVDVGSVVEISDGAAVGFVPHVIRASSIMLMMVRRKNLLCTLCDFISPLAPSEVRIHHQRRWAG